MENDIPDHIKLLEPSINEPSFNPYHFFQTPLELQRRVFYNRMGNFNESNLRSKLNSAVQNIGKEIDENFEEAEVTQQEILKPPKLLYQRIQNTKIAEDNGKFLEEQPQFVQFKHMQQQCQEKQEQFPKFNQFIQIQSIIEEKDLCLSKSIEEKINFYPITIGVRNIYEMLGVLKQESNNLNFFIRATLFQTILNSGYDRPSNLAKPKAYLLQRQIGQEVVLPLSFILQNQVIEFGAELPHGSYFLQLQSYIDCQRIQQTNFPFKVGQHTKYDLNHLSQILVNFEYQQVGKKSIYYQCLLDISLDNQVSNQSLHFFRKNNLRLNIPFHPFVQQFVKDGSPIDFPNSRILMAVIDVNGKLQNFSLYPESQMHQIIEIVKFGNISKSSLYSYDWKAPINSYLTSVDIVGEFNPGDSVIFLIASDEAQKTNKFEQQLMTLPKVTSNNLEGQPQFQPDSSFQSQLNRCLQSGESIIMFATLSIFYDKIATRGDQLYKVSLFKGVPQFKSVTKKVIDVCDEEETILFACLPNIVSNQQFGVFLPVQIVENNIQTQNQYKNIHSRMISSILLNQEIDDAQIQLLQQAVNLLNSHTVNQQMVKQIQTDLIQDFGQMDNVSFSLNCRIIKIVQYLLQAMVANSDIFEQIINSNLSDSNYYKFLALFIIVPDALAGKLTNPFMNDIRAILLSLSSRIKVDQSQQVDGSVYNIIGFENILLNIDNLIVQAKVLKEPIFKLLQLNKSKLTQSIVCLYNDIYCFIEDYQNRSYLKHNFIGGKEQQDSEFGCLSKAASQGILFDISAQILSNKDAMIQQIYMNKYLSDCIILMKLLSLLNRIDDSSFQMINPQDIFNRNTSQATSKIFYIICFIIRSFSGLYFVIKDEPIISCIIKFYPNLFSNEGIDIHYIYQDMCLITYYIQLLFKNNQCFHQDQFIQMSIQSCVYSNLQYQFEFEDSSFLMIRQIFNDITLLTFFSNKDQYLQQLLLLCFKICEQQKKVLGFVKLFNTISYGAQNMEDFSYLYELFLPIFLKSSLALLLDTETTTDDINDILIQFQVLKSFCIHTEVMGSLSPIIDYDNSFRMVILVGFLLLYQFKELYQLNKIMIVINVLLSQYSLKIAITSNDLQILYSIFDYFCSQILCLPQQDCLDESILLLSSFVQNIFHLQSIQCLIFHHVLDIAFKFLNNEKNLLPVIDCICLFCQKIQITKQMKSTFVLILSQYLPMTTQLTVQDFIIMLKHLPEDLSNILKNYLSSFYKLQKCYPLIQTLFANKDIVSSKLKDCFSFELQQGFPSINQAKQIFGAFESTYLNTNPSLFLLINNVIEPVLWQFYYLLVEYDDPRVHWILDCIFVLQFLQNDSKCVDVLQLKTDLIETYHIPDLFTSLYLIINQRSQLLMNNDSSLVSSFPTSQFQFPNYQIQNGATTIRALFLNFAAGLRQYGNLLFDDLLAINEYYSKVYPHLRCLVNSDFETSPSDFYSYQQSFFTVTQGTIDFIVNMVKSIPASLITLRSGCIIATEKSLTLPDKFSLKMNELLYYNNFVFKDQKGKIIKEEQALDSKIIFTLLGKVISLLSERNLVDDFGLSFKFFFDHPPIIDCTNKFKAQCAEKVENIQTFPTLLIDDFLFSKQSLTYGVITIFQTMRCSMMNYSNYANFQKQFIQPLIKSEIQTQMLSGLFPTIIPQFKRHIVFSKIVRHTYVDRDFVYGSFSRKYLIGIQVNQKFDYYQLSLPDFQLFNSEILSFVEGIILQLYNTSGLRYTASPIIDGIAFLNDNFCIQVFDSNTQSSAFFCKLDLQLLNIRQVSDTVLVQQAKIVYRRLGNSFMELKDFLDRFRSSNNKNTELIKRTILHMEQLAMIQDSSISMQNLASQNVSDIINQTIIQDPDDLALKSKDADQETLDIYILEFRKLLQVVLKGISIVVDSTHDENLLNSFSRNAFSLIMVKLQDVYETGEKGIFKEPDETTFIEKMLNLKSTNKPKKPGKK